mmetsp:Transcript_19151/g.24846  ORF Transcript_19151/g.24846 Transcript_19151/m.24846 type:complete len:436 (+) Transcript_19151:120-1427(+)
MKKTEKKQHDVLTIGIVLTNVALYATCYQLQRPIEPFLVQKIGADDREYGRLQSFFSFVQTLGSPVVGSFLDFIGPKIMFVIVFGSSALSYGILSQATSVKLLYLSKIPTILQAGFLVAQALVASITRGHESERAAALGRLTTAYTVGATLGPALGGILGARGDYYRGARLAVIGSIFSMLLAVLLPKESSNTNQSTDQHHSSSNHDISTKKRGQIALAKSVWPLLITKTMTGVTNSILGTALPLVLRDIGFDEKRLGLSMSVSSALVAIVGAFCLGPLSLALPGASLPARALLFKTVAVLILGLAASSGISILLATIIALHAAIAHVLATSMTSVSVGSVQRNEQGTLLGIEHALFALSRIFGPSFATSSGLGILSLCTICALIDGILALLFPVLMTDILLISPSSKSKLHHNKSSSSDYHILEKEEHDEKKQS